MIVINEEIIGKKLDKDGITSNKDALKLGIVLIKYYKYLGYSNTEIKEKLKEKIKIQEDNNNLISDYIYNTLILNMNICGEFKNSPLPIYQEELNKIKQLNNYRLEKFFFVFLSLCKAFDNKVRVHKKEIMRLSYLPESTNQFDKYFNILLNMGYLNAGITKYKIKNENKTAMYYYIDDIFYKDINTNTLAFEIKNTNNPVLFYIGFFKYDNIKVCECCNAPYIKSIKQTVGKCLCDECKHVIKKEKNKERMKNVRDQSKLK